MQMNLSFVLARNHLIAEAVEILHANIGCAEDLRKTIRAVAKAYIDEADELKRALRDMQTKGVKVQIESRSPPEITKKAMRLVSVRLDDADLQDKVRRVAESYVEISEKNQRLFNEFKKKYDGQLPPSRD